MFGGNTISLKINFIQQLIRNYSNTIYYVTKDCIEHFEVCRMKQLRNKTIKAKSPFPQLNLILSRRKKKLCVKVSFIVKSAICTVHTYR